MDKTILVLSTTGGCGGNLIMGIEQFTHESICIATQNKDKNDIEELNDYEIMTTSNKIINLLDVVKITDLEYAAWISKYPETYIITNSTKWIKLGSFEKHPFEKIYNICPHADEYKILGNKEQYIRTKEMCSTQRFVVIPFTDCKIYDLVDYMCLDWGNDTRYEEDDGSYDDALNSYKSECYISGYFANIRADFKYNGNKYHDIIVAGPLWNPSPDNPIYIHMGYMVIGLNEKEHFRRQYKFIAAIYKTS